jgi:hypothetical protein
MADGQYPEHERMAKIVDASQQIGEFIENGGYVLAHYNDSGRLVPDQRTTFEILADFFDIDLDKIESEKRAMLDAIRKEHG